MINVTEIKPEPPMRRFRIDTGVAPLILTEDQARLLKVQLTRLLPS